MEVWALARPPPYHLPARTLKSVPGVWTQPSCPLPSVSSHVTVATAELLTTSC